MSISLQDISIGYSAPVVSAIDAELVSGSFTCLVGRNGSGKSTLLKTIAGLIKPISGQMSNSHSVGIVLTGFPALQNTSVFELVSYGRIPHQNLFAKLRESDRKAIEDALETVGMAAFSERMVNQLSDGEKQKVMIARALAQGTDVLLLDEPSAFLDYPSKRVLMQLLSDLAHHQRRTILLSTHDVELAKQYADCIWHIADHRLICTDASAFDIGSL